MADLRVLKLALLAETKDFIDGLDKATKETKTFNQKLGKALKIGAAAFAALGAAAGAAAIKIGKDAVEAAIEDQQSQTQLAKALKNSTNATDSQIKSMEKYVTKIQNASGVTDTQLRQSLGNLVRSTQDATKAQELNNIAVDISIATGKDLNTVSEALAKAYQGQTGALTRLDPSIAGVIKQGADANEIFDALAKTFGGAAAENADTFAGKFEIIKRRIEDAVEAIGYALLPIIEKVAKFISEKFVPAFEGLVRGLTGGPRTVRGATIEANSAFAEMGIVIDENDSAAYDLGESIRNLTKTIGDLFKTAEEGAVEESGLVKFLRLIEKIIDAIDRAIRGIQTLKQNIGAGLDVIGLQAPLAATEAAGETFRERLKTAPTVGGARAGQINVVVNNAVDPNATARKIKETLDKARAVTGISFSRPGFF